VTSSDSSALSNVVVNKGFRCWNRQTVRRSIVAVRVMPRLGLKRSRDKCTPVAAAAVGMHLRYGDLLRQLRANRSNSCESYLLTTSN
jgi:hypothetical protein